MKLTEKDIEILKEYGNLDEDVPQLREAAQVAKYTLYPRQDGDEGEEIGERKAIKLLGRKCWLSGISRAAFHCTSCRETTDKRYILFDCSAIWR